MAGADCGVAAAASGVPAEAAGSGAPEHEGPNLPSNSSQQQGGKRLTATLLLESPPMSPEDGPWSRTVRASKVHSLALGAPWAPERLEPRIQQLPRLAVLMLHLALSPVLSQGLGYPPSPRSPQGPGRARKALVAAILPSSGCHVSRGQHTSEATATSRVRRHGGSTAPSWPSCFCRSPRPTSRRPKRGPGRLRQREKKCKRRGAPESLKRRRPRGQAATLASGAEARTAKISSSEPTPSCSPKLSSRHCSPPVEMLHTRRRSTQTVSPPTTWDSTLAP